jgi:hypothetical protein
LTETIFPVLAAMTLQGTLLTADPVSIGSTSVVLRFEAAVSSMGLTGRLILSSHYQEGFSTTFRFSGCDFHGI